MVTGWGAASDTILREYQFNKQDFLLIVAGVKNHIGYNMTTGQ
jgi:hypothetical protein